MYQIRQRQNTATISRDGKASGSELAIIAKDMKNQCQPWEHICAEPLCIYDPTFLHQHPINEPSESFHNAQISLMH